MSLNNNDPVKPVETTPEIPLTKEEIGRAGSMNAGRRKIARLGIGAPLVLTLASRSVLANQCLSNMLSGNLSNPTRGNCEKGWSPGGWGQPGGNISTYSTLGAWQAIGYYYGSLKSNCSASQAACYTGGTKMSGLPTYLNKDSVPANTRVADVLNNIDSKYQLTRHLICAYFNAKLGELAGGSFNYIMTVAQVQQLASGALLPPGGMSLIAFLDSTWN